jgi:energy-coupling factor transporter ATP-binding protein EcfA2
VVARLSAGQRRRTSLAVLVARRPELWLLDEPHAALDQEGRDLVDGLMVDAVAAGATVVFASHELDRATAVAHRTITIAGGTVAWVAWVAWVARPMPRPPNLSWGRVVSLLRDAGLVLPRTSASSGAAG